MFVALDPPERARAALAAWRDELLAGRPELRPVAPAALHVTLVFLGWQAEAAADRIAAAGFHAAAGLEAPVLTPAGVKPVPPRRPRLLALDLEDQDGRCARLQAALARALAEGGFYQPEKRPFWAHVTLARARGGATIATPIPEDPGRDSPDAFPASALTLYRSILRPQGALYEPLGRVALGDA